MGVIACDFETFYTTEYSLTRLSTEEYIRSPLFEVIGVSISDNGRPPIWYSGSSVEPALRAIDWSRNSLLAYNTAFDGAILGWIYGLYPALYLDVMGMARCCGKTYLSASLAKVLMVMNLGAKGTSVLAARGKHLHDFTPIELHEYGLYCCNDTSKTMDIYRVLIKGYPPDEIRLQDQTLRMFIEPVLTFNREVLQAHYDDVVQKKWEGLSAAARIVGLEYEGVAAPTDPELFRSYDTLAEGGYVAKMRDMLSSGPQFAKLLEELGVEVPTKLSPATGNLTHALAKTDPAFLELLEHDDPRVQAVVAARLGTKSTIEETRAERFLGIQSRGAWPIMYNYFGANTSRFTGGDKVNPQNLTRGGRLRDAVMAPPGHMLNAGDLGQIECRIINYLAEQDDIIEAFCLYDAGEGPDVYCIFAGKVYRMTVTPENKRERMVGKVGELSLGFGAGHKSYKKMVFAQCKGLVIPVNEAQNVVEIYRASHTKVVQLWRQADRVLDALIGKWQFTLGRTGMLDGTHPEIGIGLPNGTYIRYPGLRKFMNEKGEVKYVYTKGGKEVEVYGAKVVQNVTEGLARIVMTDAWLRIARHYRVVLTCHDELVTISPIVEAEKARELMHTEMTRSVAWAPGLPIACTVGSGATYGDCK